MILTRRSRLMCYAATKPYLKKLQYPLLVITLKRMKLICKTILFQNAIF